MRKVRLVWLEELLSCTTGIVDGALEFTSSSPRTLPFYPAAPHLEWNQPVPSTDCKRCLLFPRHLSHQCHPPEYWLPYFVVSPVCTSGWHKIPGDSDHKFQSPCSLHEWLKGWPGSQWGFSGCWLNKRVGGGAGPWARSGRCRWGAGARALNEKDLGRTEVQDHLQLHMEPELKLGKYEFLK